MRGKLLKGAEAASLGLVNYAFPKDDVVDEAHKIATEIAGNPLWAVRWSKAAVNKQLKAQLNQTLELSIAYESLTLLTEDSKEDRKSGVSGKSVSVREDLGDRRTIK